MTIAELELLAWAWAVPAENPFIWALTLTLLPAQTPGTRKVPWVPLVAMVPGRVRRETLAPDSGRPDGVITEPKRMWLGHLQVSELHPRGTWEQQRQRELLGRALHLCNPASHQFPTSFVRLDLSKPGARDKWAELEQCEEGGPIDAGEKVQEWTTEADS